MREMRTERLVLRPFTVGDAADCFREIYSDVAVVEHYSQLRFSDGGREAHHQRADGPPVPGGYHGDVDDLFLPVPDLGQSPGRLVGL